MNPKSKLQKSVGLPGLVTYYITSILGVGILIIPSVAGGVAGPASILSWAALIVASLPLAWFFARMSIAYPDSGGIFTFVTAAWGKHAGKTVGILLALTMIIGNPIMGLASARYIQHIFAFTSETAWILIGFGMMVLSVLFNLIGLKLGTRVQMILLGVLVIGLTAVIAFAVPHIQTENYTPFVPHGLSSIGLAATICFYSFLGWENVSAIAEEVKNPRHYVPAILISLAVIGVLYLAVAIIYIGVIPSEQLSGSTTVLNSLLRVIAGERMSQFGNIFAVLLIVLSTNAWVLGASRLLFSLAKQGVLPRVFSKVSAGKAVPYAALLALTAGYGVIAILLLIFNWQEQQLIVFVNANFFIIYFLAFAGGMKLFPEASGKWISFSAFAVTACFVPFFREGIAGSLIALAVSAALAVVQGMMPGSKLLLTKEGHLYEDQKVTK